MSKIIPTPLVLAIAVACHQANKVWCEMNGDTSQKNWEEAEEWQQQSAIKGVMFRIDNPNAGHDAQHNSWMQEKIADGWVYGPEKDAELKTHPCLVPFEELSEVQQKKDALFCGIVDALSGVERKASEHTTGFDNNSKGAKMVRVEFNPGNNDQVQNTKEAYARIINRTEKLRSNNVAPEDQSELQRLVSLSQTKAEESAMFAVKAATIKKLD